MALQFVDCASAHCADAASKTYVLAKSRRHVPVLPPGYPKEPAPPSPERRAELRKAAGVREDEIVLLQMARIAPEKAQDQLLRAFRIIHDRHPNTRLWISGTGLDWVERDLRKLRSELGLEGSAEFLGFRHDRWSLLHAADFMAHTSHAEGIPAAIMEGLAAGLTVVASDVGGIREEVDHGRSGMLVKENDVEGFARTINELIENRPRALAMGQAARRSVENEHSLETAVARVEDLYRTVLKR